MRSGNTNFITDETNVTAQLALTHGELDIQPVTGSTRQHRPDPGKLRQGGDGVEMDVFC